MERRALRPIERAVLRLEGEGLSTQEIAWRFRRSPAHVRRILWLSRLPRTPGPPRPEHRLRPIERSVLRARANGSGREEIAARLRRTPAHVERIETYARYKQNTPSAAS